MVGITIKLDPLAARASQFAMIGEPFGDIKNLIGQSKLPLHKVLTGDRGGRSLFEEGMGYAFAFGIVAGGQGIDDA